MEASILTDEHSLCSGNKPTLLSSALSDAVFKTEVNGNERMDKRIEKVNFNLLRKHK